MALSLTYPGVYVQELPSGVRTITGVATSIAAFVGRAWRGPVDQPVTIFSYADYERQFGGLWLDSSMSYAVQQFFLNGGGQAVIVRVASSPQTATIELAGGLTLEAASPGSWALNLKVSVIDQKKDSKDDTLFSLTILDDPKLASDALGRGGGGMKETFLNLSVDPKDPRYVTTVLEQQSNLVRVKTGPGTKGPDVQADVVAKLASGTVAADLDGKALTDSDLVGGTHQADSTGLYALDHTDIFNLLCIPPLKDGEALTTSQSIWTAAAKYCSERRALYLVDAPADWEPTDIKDHLDDVNQSLGDFKDYAATYFPRVMMIDPLRDNNLAPFAPCGIVAGVYARTDASRGVWKAPAGVDAGMSGVMGLSINGTVRKLTDQEIGVANPLGVNCLRGMPGVGHVVWGARTADGKDAFASQWKYVPVRRLALYIEESLFRGTQWVVFEPNDEPLWAQIRLNVGAFMQTLFRQGAFQGATPQDAYFVKCSSETTTQTDIDNGRVNIVVGFAPLKPAEFVVLQIQQISQQS